jgi:AraC-like DNA-binding protein
MNQIDWLLTITALALGNCLLFAVYLFTVRTRDAVSYRLLGLFLITLGIRIGKSVITLMVPEYVELLTSIGVVSMWAIGPSMYLYFRSSFGKQLLFDKKLTFHFIPVLILILILPFVYLNEEIIFNIYLTSIIQLLVYLSVSIKIMVKFAKTHSNNKVKKNWGTMFLIGIGTIWVCFVFQVTFETYFVYLLATLMSSAILFTLGLWAMNRQRFYSLGSQKENDNGLLDISREVSELFEETNIYLKEAITVKNIAMKLGIKPYLVSQAINTNYGKSFPELVTDYRIKHAKKLLALGDKQKNIKAVAFESGFATLSAFYTSFRKNTKMTPREFREMNFQN